MALDIIQIILAAILGGLILVQGKGSGLSTFLGGTGNIYQTKRGAEKFFHLATVIVAIAFLGLSFFNAIY